MISGKYGLGYRIWEAYTLIRYPLIVVGMVAIGILGLASSAIIRYLGGRLIPWHSRRLSVNLDCTTEKIRFRSSFGKLQLRVYLLQFVGIHFHGHTAHDQFQGEHTRKLVFLRARTPTIPASDPDLMRALSPTTR